MFRHAKISQLDYTLRIYKYVGTFNISVRQVTFRTLFATKLKKNHLNEKKNL